MICKSLILSCIKVVIMYTAVPDSCSIILLILLSQNVMSYILPTQCIYCVTT